MAIISSYFPGENFGLLGPQMAATIIEQYTPYDCIVIAVARDDDHRVLKKALAEYFGRRRPIVGFSALSGRRDLFALASDLKNEGAFTVLAGPQAGVDFRGEVGWPEHPHRFNGVSDSFCCAIHGPAEQIIPLLKVDDPESRLDFPGFLYNNNNGKIISHQSKNWEEKFLEKVTWNNLYRIDETSLHPISITTGQILQQIGCPYAAKSRWVDLDYPAFIQDSSPSKVKQCLKGCSFCDVATDKGFYGELDIRTVLNQIRGLPETTDGRKIPFELINENPLPGLSFLITQAAGDDLKLSQINLTLRADWFLKKEGRLRAALKKAKHLNIRLVVSSIGFESFDDKILRNLNKGIDVETNLETIRLLRRLKNEFPQHLGYLRKEGGNHGFIHPTPWDTPEISNSINTVVQENQLALDILPNHSTPLIIHHASGLAEWLRCIEKTDRIKFSRNGSILEWWQADGNLFL